jgi:MraZ protein
VHPVEICVAEWGGVGYSGRITDRSGGAPPTPPLRSTLFPRRFRAWALAFRGHFEYSLDAKNRLNVPPKFRAAFSDGVVLAKALEPCVAVWTPDAFERHTDAFLSGLNPLSAERRKLTRFFAGGSFDIEMDAAGRVTLNTSLIRHGEISKDVVVVGVIDHLQVWDRDKWLADQDELSAEIVEIAESLGNPS